MNTSSNAGQTRRRPLATAAFALASLAIISLAACNESPTTTSAVETVGIHKYARGYEPSAKGPGKAGTAAACADTGTIAKDIGDGGGTLSIGGTTLTFPSHNGMNKVKITMVLLPGTASVQFYPEGLVFRTDKQPVLTINTDCIGNPENSDIVYTDDTGLILQYPNSFHLDSHSVSAYIAHFSRYAVDW